MAFDETDNSPFLAGSGYLTDIYDAGSGPVTTNPMATGFALTCPPYNNGGEYLVSPERVYEPMRRFYNHEYTHQPPSLEYYNDQSHP